MAFSYSFHLSSKSHAVGTVNKIGQVSRHNLRQYESADYDRNQIEILAGSDKSILDDVKQIYHDEFDEALRKNNEGKRPDRKIDDYLTHVSNSKSDCACELIIQIGDKDFWKDKTMEEKKQMTYIFKDQLRSLKKLVPELKVGSAVIHYDESSPHMHIVGVPVANGYEKGMEKRVSKTKIFTKDRLSYLQDRMRENAEQGLKLEQNKNLFEGMELKAKEKGRNKDMPKASLEKYNLLIATSVKLSDQKRTEPVELEVAEGEKISLTPVHELIRRSEGLEADISTLKSQIGDLRANRGELEGVLSDLKDEIQKQDGRSEAYQKVIDAGHRPDIMRCVKRHDDGSIDLGDDGRPRFIRLIYDVGEPERVKIGHEDFPAEQQVGFWQVIMAAVMRFFERIRELVTGKQEEAARAQEIIDEAEAIKTEKGNLEQELAAAKDRAERSAQYRNEYKIQEPRFGKSFAISFPTKREAEAFRDAAFFGQEIRKRETALDAKEQNVSDREEAVHKKEVAYESEARFAKASNPIIGKAFEKAEYLTKLSLAHPEVMAEYKTKDERFDMAYEQMRREAASIAPGKEKRCTAALERLKDCLERDGDRYNMLSTLYEDTNPIKKAQDVICLREAAREQEKLEAPELPKEFARHRGHGISL